MHGYKVKTIFINFDQKEKKKPTKTRFIKTDRQLNFLILDL